MSPLGKFLLIASIAALSTPVATALSITFDDRTETPTLFFDSSSYGITEGPETFDFLPDHLFPAVNVRFIFLEPGSSTNVSDIVSLTVTNNTIGSSDVRIVFQSNRETPLAMPAPLPIDKIITETGAFQTLYSATSPDNSLLIIRFASDVPEPATLALLGIGLAGIGFARRRKSH